jgi:hypothetical protein
MLAVYEHISPVRLHGLLAEAYRLLAPGGVYVMTTPAGWTGWLLDLLARTGMVSHDEIGEHQGSYSHKQIRERLLSAGFDPVGISMGYFECFANNWAVATK